jgi:phosphatidylserine/phosphatidylglycerophosphate/cardiolipin synthase-like enzyme
MYRLVVVFIVILSCIGAWGVLKPLPGGVRVVGAEHSIESDRITFLADRTFMNARDERMIDHEIFDTIFATIDAADSYILIDMFLFNDLLGSATTSARTLSSELVSHLLDAKNRNPDMTIQVITDPVNQIYGGYTSPQFQKLQKAGIPVIETNLKVLRDSNPAYSSLWRLVLQHTPLQHYAFLPNILDARAPKLGVGPYLTLLNFKANHRKVLVADSGSDLVTIISSGNPHDGSSAHSNSAVAIRSVSFAREGIAIEAAVAKISGAELMLPANAYTDSSEKGEATVQLVSEGAIKVALIELIQTMQKDESIDMAMFYLADRDVIEALKAADMRGVQIRALLDPNKDAFGRKKDGVPNRPVAHELTRDSSGNTVVRWCDTHGEQCHSKLTIFRMKDREAMLLGSANLTRRNIGDFNLESNVLITGSRVRAINDAQRFFEDAWGNRDGKYSVPYEDFADERPAKYWQYRFMETTGMSSF